MTTQLLQTRSELHLAISAHVVRKKLCSWYAQNARDLPWRHTTEPYAIWVSEVMLQQTQVSTVVPYYTRFLWRFPSVSSLAAASHDEVLKIWQGLGYYRRAVNLHRASREIVGRFHGQFPSDSQSLRSLPGVGRYIAGAIQSIAFDSPAPILEANSARVLCRLFAIRGILSSTPVQKRLWVIAESLLPREQAGQHNQALMELGALVCVPGRPRCERCPLQSVCLARASGLTQRIPETPKRAKFVDVQDAAVILRRNGRVLIVQRRLSERWGGLWELPRTTITDGDDPRESLRSHVRASLGLKIDVGRHVMSVKHGVMNHRITLNCFETVRVSGKAHPKGYADCRWELPRRLEQFAYSSPQRRLITAIQSRPSSSSTF